MIIRSLAATLTRPFMLRFCCRLLSIVPAIVMLATSALHAQPAPPAASAPSLDAQMRKLLEWFPGEFDNNQQVVSERESKAANPHEWIHSYFARVTQPALGRVVFYVEQYQNGNPSDIYRQRLYTFTPDPASKSIVLRIYTFPDEAAVRGAHKDPTKLNGLTIGQLRATPGCEVYWRFDGTSFTGSMLPKACRVIARASGKPIFISDDLTLTADEIWISDRAVDEAGARVFGHPDNVHHKLRRAHRYSCWVAVKGELPNAEWQGARNVSTHDQGGQIPLPAVDGKPATRYADLGELLYANGQGPRVLRLAMKEIGQDASIGYGWTEPGSARVGVSMPNLQSGCTRDP